MAIVLAFPTTDKPKSTNLFSQMEQANLVVTLSEYGMTHGYPALFEVVTAAFERYERETSIAQLQFDDPIWDDLLGGSI